MYAAVQYVDFSAYKRIIIISDIHADVDGFLGVMKKVKFGKEDALVIVGDILEKGRHSLKMLRLVMEYYLQGNVYMVAGNNDTIYSEWFEDRVSTEDVLWYVTHRRYSILKDMAEILGLPAKTSEDILALKTAIAANFREELDFLNQLPHILESDIATFVHAGIKPGSLETQDRDYCMTALEFAKQPFVFKKKVIVGHWPASNYCQDIISVNIHRNAVTNVISMDGGNSMKQWQQINYLILDSSGRELESGYYDNLPRIEVLEDQEESENYFTLIFPNTLVEIREAGEEKSVCYVPWLKREITIDNDCIYEYKRKTYCTDMTTYQMPVKAGEILSCCGQTREGLQVKRNGIVGNYHGRYRKVEN